MRAIAEMSPAAQKRAHKAYPGMHITADAMEVITAPDIDAIAVITPVWTHYELAKAALENGKHVFVEKPFTSNVAQGEELIDLAIQKNLRIMVDHTFLFTGAVRKIPQLLGKERWEVVLLRLHPRQSGAVSARHQRSLGSGSPRSVHHGLRHRGSPEAVVATGQSHLNAHEDVAFMTLYFRKMSLRISTSTGFRR